MRLHLPALLGLPQLEQEVLCLPTVPTDDGKVIRATGMKVE